MSMEWDDEDERLKDVIRSILVQKAPIFAGLKDGFVVHYLSDVLLGQYQLRTQLDATLRGVLVVDQLVHVAILDECKIFLWLLVLEKVDPGEAMENGIIRIGYSSNRYSEKKLNDEDMREKNTVNNVTYLNKTCSNLEIRLSQLENFLDVVLVKK